MTACGVADTAYTEVKPQDPVYLNSEVPAWSFARSLAGQGKVRVDLIGRTSRGASAVFDPPTATAEKTIDVHLAASRIGYLDALPLRAIGSPQRQVASHQSVEEDRGRVESSDERTKR